MKRRLLDGKKLEWIVLGLYAALYIVITVFHEPWFDEAQVWQIAKCASLREMLFEVPHYEGHPPLWSLLLALPAKSGVPFEIGLKTIGFILSMACVYLILFRMPYPRLMRLLLPFSFFILYQYGVIVRPYTLMLLTLLLLALAFPKRSAHPWRFAGLLALLCLTSAYGIVMAGGIALGVVWDLIAEKGFRAFVRGLFTDPRTLSLGCLLALAILLILDIMPRENTFVTSKNPVNPLIPRLLCALFTYFGECTLTTSSWFGIDATLIQFSPIPYPELALFCVVGAILWLVIVCASSKRALKYFVIPYILFALFSAIVYGSAHHAGIVLMLLLFWIGMLFQDERRFEIGRALADRLRVTERDRKLLRRAALALCACCLVVPIYWCASSMALEIQYEYSYGRSGSAFMREHGLEDSLIMAPWGLGSVEEFEDSYTLNEIKSTYFVGMPVVLNAYFDHNICMNLDCGRDEGAYFHYRVATEAEREEAYAAWKRAGVPELLIGQPEFEELYEGVSRSEYTIIYLLRMNGIWKTTISQTAMPLYARKDVLEKYHLEPLNDVGLEYWLDGITVTDEMREQYRAGVPVEEIINPYLDAVFGEAK